MFGSMSLVVNGNYMFGVILYDFSVVKVVVLYLCYCGGFDVVIVIDG